MMISSILGVTRRIGKSQGFIGLPIRDAQQEIRPGVVAHTMTSAWEPTPEDLKRLNAGGKVYLQIAAPPNGHPPVLLYTEEPVDDED